VNKSFFNLKLIFSTVLLLLLVTPISVLAQQDVISPLPPLPDIKENAPAVTSVKLPYTTQRLNVDTSNAAGTVVAGPDKLGGSPTMSPSPTSNFDYSAYLAKPADSLVPNMYPDSRYYAAQAEKNPTPTYKDTSTNICKNGICNYTLLAPVGTFIGTDESKGKIYQITQDSNSLCKLLNSWFRIGIALAGMLAVVMIVIGGFQYATTDSLFGKSEGRTKVDNALFGLALALGTWLILNTINPALTNCSLDAKATTALGSVGAGTSVASAGTSASVPGSLAAANTGSADISGSSGREAIARTAENSVGTHQSDFCSSDRVGCADGVNTVTLKATGKQAGGGASTANLAEALGQNPDWKLVPGGLTDAQPGDIVVSPTQGTFGHAGIVGTNGQIIANNSNTGLMTKGDYTTSNWGSKVGDRRGLPTYVYTYVGPAK